MRRVDIVAITAMVVMTIIWIPGCPRNDLIDQGQSAVVPEQVQEPAEPAPAQPVPDATAPEATVQTPAETAPNAAAEAPGAEAHPVTAEPAPEPARPSSQPEPEAAPVPAPASESAPKPAEPAAQAAPAPTPAAPAADEGTVVIGRISVVSHVPEASEVPYTECLTMVKYTVESVESGSYGEKELLAAFWGMRGAKLQPAAKFHVGQRHRLVIEPLADHPDLLRAMQADDTNEYTLSPQWVVKYSAP